MQFRRHVDSKLLARLEKIEQKIVQKISARQVIGNALLIGDAEQNYLLHGARCQRHCIFSSQYTPSNQNIVDNLCVGKIEQLPFAKDSIDLAVLPHVVEFSPQPQLVLDEITTILSKKGLLLLFGFSHWNYLSIKKLSDLPFHSFTHIKDAILKTGLTITTTQSYFSLGAQLTDSTTGKFLDRMLASHLPFLCSAYFILAQSFTAPITPQPFGFLAKPKFALAFEDKECPI